METKRRSTRPEIVTINPQGSWDASKCSKFATITATSRVPARKTAIIIAEDTVSGQQLRCDVIVDEISSIAIETTTHELYLDDSPEEFVIRAMNEEGDVFSSLDGVAFEWNLLPDTVKGQNLAPVNNILRFLSFYESVYEAMGYIESLEKQGKRGDRILVRGIRTGSAKVSAKLDDSAYKHVVEAIVRIIVMANIQLNPPLVYLMQHTTVTYVVELIKQNKVHYITMPSSQYYLEVGNKLIASMNERTSTATALLMGDTEVMLKDRNINLSGMFRDPSAGIYVVNPGYLEFQVFPDPNWVLQSNKVYQITIEVYDKESHRIYPSDNIRIEAEFPKEYFEVSSSSDNGTYHIVKTLKKGFTDIHGVLKAVVLEDGTRHLFDPEIKNSQEVEIYDPIKVIPPIVVLPWIPVKTANYMFPLTAKGGSGNYTWSSSATDVATVTTKGQVVTATVTGETVVKAADSKNMAHYDTMQTIVLPPNDMEFLPSRVEAEIGTYLELPLAVYGKLKGKRHRFDDCHLMPLNTVLGDKLIFTHVEETKPSLEGSCASVKVKAMSQGHTQLSVLYEYKDVKLKAVVTIAAYKPLRPVDPEEITVVTPAASRDMIFEGGPQPWVLDPSGYFQILGAERKDIVGIYPVRKFDAHKTRHTFRVLCKKLGEQTLSLQVGNKPTAKNHFPAKSTASVKFACEEPTGIRLIPLVTHPIGLPPCPVNVLYDDPVPVHSYKDLHMQVMVNDRLGRKFDNFSSLTLAWKLSDVSLASFVAITEKEQLVTKVAYGEKTVITTYRTLTMMGRSEMLHVTATIMGYNSDLFTGHFPAEGEISDTRILHLVKDVTIEPEAITLYNYATNKASLEILHGSGHFFLDHNNANHAKVVYNEKKTRDIELTPISEGQFTITAYDLCVEGLISAKANVFVSDVHTIVLNVVDKVEIYKEIVAEVQVYDEHNMLIPAKYFTHMSLKAQPGADIIAVRQSGKLRENSTSASYIVKGSALGTTTLQFVANQKTGNLVYSKPQKIQVFPPLRLEPRNITLIIGAIFQVSAHGGPEPQSTIEFFMKNDKIASISSTGLLEALTLGTSNIVGRAVGVDGANGVVVYSQDEVTVHVVQLEGIRIFAPLKRLQTGTQMPLYAMGLNENETPFTFGSAMPPLNFYWTIRNKDVATLSPLFYKSGIIPKPENNFAVNMFAEKAGHVTVRLSVTTSPGSRLQIRNNQELTDDVQIQVFERLQLTSPAVCDGKLLMTPNTETKVITNRDGSTSRLSYTVQSQQKQAVISVDESGHLQSNKESGQASLIITSHEDFGVNQSLVILVQVKPISYIMINAETVIHTHGVELSAVPIGTSLQFSISYHDAVGEKFFATNCKIKYSYNRYDIVQFTQSSKNDTLQGRATNIGHTVLKVWDRENPRLADYVNIGVGHAITPLEDVLTLGDVVCYSSPIVTKQGRPGDWLSDNGAIQVDEHSGIGVATLVGSTLLTYNVSASMSTYTEVHVKPITSIKLQEDSVQYLSNVVKSYKHDPVVPLDITAHDGKVLKSSIKGSNCTAILEEDVFVLKRFVVHCEASLSSPHSHLIVKDIVDVTTELNVHTGKYQCKLTPIVNSKLTSIISTLNANIVLKAVVFPRDNQPEVVSPGFSVPYIPAFHVQPEALSLSNEVPIVKLRISGTENVLQDLKVQTLDTSLIMVSGPERDHRGDSVAHYPVILQLSSTLWDRHQLETTIEITSSLTGQIEIVPVKVKLIGSKDDQPKTVFSSWSDLITAIAKNYQSIILTLIYIILTIACIVIAYHVVLGQRYQSASQQSNVFMTPGGSPSQQQQQFSGMASPWNSPQSPNISATPTRLWTVDYGPYEASSLFKRSPLRQSPTHS